MTEIIGSLKHIPLLFWVSVAVVVLIPLIEGYTDKTPKLEKRKDSFFFGDKPVVPCVKCKGAVATYNLYNDPEDEYAICSPVCEMCGVAKLNTHLTYKEEA